MFALVGQDGLGNVAAVDEIGAFFRQRFQGIGQVGIAITEVGGQEMVGRAK